jgi:SAM-dependent methyltransferase
MTKGALEKKCVDFWKNCVAYPKFGSNLRRFYELQYLVPRIKGDSLLDLGCGDGILSALLLDTTEIKRVYGLDVSSNLLGLVDERIIQVGWDLRKGFSLVRDIFPKVDTTIMSSVIQYILEDVVFDEILRDLKTKTIFIKSPFCRKDKTINKNKSGVGDRYVSRYRKLDEVIYMVNEHFKVTDVCRAYPDEIESKFGSLQYWIKGEK